MTDSMTPSAEERAYDLWRTIARKLVPAGSVGVDPPYAPKIVIDAIEKAWADGRASREPEIEAARREQLEADCAVALAEGREWGHGEEDAIRETVDDIRAAFDAKEGK